MDYSAPQQPKERSLKLIIFTSLSIMPFAVGLTLVGCFLNNYTHEGNPFNFFAFILFFLGLGKVLALIDNYILAFCRGVVKSKSTHFGIQLMGSIIDGLFMLALFFLIIITAFNRSSNNDNLILLLMIFEQVAYVLANVQAYMTIFNAIEQGGVPVVQGIGIARIDPAPLYPHNPQPYGQPQIQPPAYINYGQGIPGQHTLVVAKQ